MWFSHKPDDPNYIYLDAKHTKALPLVCDPVVYSAGVASMREILGKWVILDRDSTENTGQNPDGAVSWLLAAINVKQLPAPSHFIRLRDILAVDNINSSGSRLWDALALIYTVVPTEVVNTYVGKFLYAMTTCIPPLDPNKQKRYTLEQWVEAVELMPIIPFILLIQEICTDDVLANLNPTNTNLGTTVVKVNGSTGAPEISNT